jgi:hypothetical protein
MTYGTTYFAIVKAGLGGEDVKLVTYPSFDELPYLLKGKFVEDLRKEVVNLHRRVIREEINKGQKELDL